MQNYLFCTWLNEVKLDFYATDVLKGGAINLKSTVGGAINLESTVWGAINLESTVWTKKQPITLILKDQNLTVSQWVHLPTHWNHRRKVCSVIQLEQGFLAFSSVLLFPQNFRTVTSFFLCAAFEEWTTKFVGNYYNLLVKWKKGMYVMNTQIHHYWHIN